MPRETSIGVRLKRLRRDRGLTQEVLAERAGVSVDVVRKLEQDVRGSARTTTLVALANVLDVDLSGLVGKRPRLDRDDDLRVLALRDTLLDPDLLTGVAAGEPVPLEELRTEELRARVASAWNEYWSGRFSRLVAVLPGLVADGRAAATDGLAAAGLLAQAYQLIACVLVHFGKDDLAVVGAERAIRAAEAGDDELQWAALHGTYAWALLHQGRTDASERHAARMAERLEPQISTASLQHLTVWGGLLLCAMAAAAAGNRGDAALEYVGLARAAAGRYPADRNDYQVNFGRTQVAMQETHAWTILGEPGNALRAAEAVRRKDLVPISWGRHLIDIAQAHADAEDLTSAERSLLDAEALSPEWFGNQGPARSLVGELVQESRRLSQPLQRLAQSVGVHR